MRAHARRMFRALFGRHDKFVKDVAIETVMSKTRRHMQMIVPHFLTAAWLVVLARGNAIARVRALQRKRNLLRDALNVRANFGRQFKNIFVMRVGDNEDVGRVFRILMQRDQRGHSCIPIHNIGQPRMVARIFNPLRNIAKRTAIMFGRVFIHAYPDSPRAQRHSTRALDVARAETLPLLPP